MWMHLISLSSVLQLYQDHGPLLLISMRTIFNSGFVVFCPGSRWWRDLCWTVVAASAVGDDGRPVGSGCWCFPAMAVHGGVSHHATSHVWALAWCHWCLHPDPCQNLGGGELKHLFRCVFTEYSQYCTVFFFTSRDVYWIIRNSEVWTQCW